MRNSLAYCLGIALVLLSPQALGCGGGFGTQVTIDPAQTIVVTQRDGQQTYVFQPQFCGAASEFGLILPVPAALSAEPKLAPTSLHPQLAQVTAPRVETVEICARGGFLGSGSKAGMDSDSMESNSWGSGVNVVATGTVDIFSWWLLQATNSAVLTDWLDARRFPYPSSAPPIFDHYVRAGWYFVAFQVTASDAAPATGQRLCGSFGPIQLGFPSARAVIPARMATAADTSSSFIWRLFTVAAHQMVPTQSAGTAQVVPTLRYAGALTTNDLQEYPAVAALAKAGEWVTELDLSFAAGSLTDDIVVAAAPTDVAYRRTVYQEKEVDCGVFGCAMARLPSGSAWTIALLTLFGGLGIMVGRTRSRSANR